MSDASKLLVVRPTIPGYGRVVGKLSDWPASADWAGCVVVYLTPEYERGHKHEVGGEVAYDARWCGNDPVDGRRLFKYYTVIPDTTGT